MEDKQEKYIKLKLSNYYGDLEIYRMDDGEYFLCLGCVPTKGGFEPISKELALLLIEELKEE